MAVMIAGFRVDFAWLLHAVMQERAFKVTTTYPLPCMVFDICILAGVPVWHIDVLKIPSGILDIGLIRDESNELAPNRGPCIEVQPLGENQTATVEQAQGANPDTSERTDTTLVEAILSVSTTPSSSHSIPSATLVPLARVQKLESQMAKLLHHIQPWI